MLPQPYQQLAIPIPFLNFNDFSLNFFTLDFENSHVFSRLFRQSSIPTEGKLWPHTVVSPSFKAFLILNFNGSISFIC